MRFEMRAKYSIRESGLGIGLKDHVGHAAHPGGQHHRARRHIRRRQRRQPVGVCARRARHRAWPEQASKDFSTSVLPPLPFSPPTRSVSSGSPACGTSFISNPALCSDQHHFPFLAARQPLRAMAIAGKTCPPVPPPAIKSFTPVSADNDSFRIINFH